jgi:hypothetical protein
MRGGLVVGNGVLTNFDFGAGSSESSPSSLVVSTSPEWSLVTRHRVPAKNISAATCMSSFWSMNI